MRFGFGSGGKRGLRAESGMTAVEFALLMPVMLLVVCGIMDFGNLYFQMNVVGNAAREAARIGAVTKNNASTVQTTIRNEYGNSLTLTFNPNPPATGGAVTATVTNSVHILTPIINQLIPDNPTTVSGQCVMQVEN